MRRRLGQIYRENRQGLFTLSLSITGNREMAEDAVQEAFARLWRMRRQPQGDPVAYAFAAVRNAAIDQVRRRRGPSRELTEAASIFDGRAPDPARVAIDAERLAILRQAVDSLPIEQREVIAMKLYAGLTFRQIADALQEPLPTVASRYRRTLEKLRDSVGDLL